MLLMPLVNPSGIPDGMRGLRKTCLAMRHGRKSIRMLSTVRGDRSALRRGAMGDGPGPTQTGWAVQHGALMVETGGTGVAPFPLSSR
jgi:hypothetical protein